MATPMVYMKLLMRCCQTVIKPVQDKNFSNCKQRVILNLYIVISSTADFQNVNIDHGGIGTVHTLNYIINVQGKFWIMLHFDSSYLTYSSLADVKPANWVNLSKSTQCQYWSPAMYISVYSTSNKLFWADLYPLTGGKTGSVRK